MADIRQKAEALRRDFYNSEGRLAAMKEDFEQVEHSLSLDKGNMLIFQEAQLFLQSAAEQAKEQAKNLLESVVTSALQQVFESDISFEIELKESRGRTEAEFYVVINMGDQIIRATPQDSRGGGVVDIVAIALRIAILQLYNDPHIKGPIILDEPGKHVSEEFAIKLATFLQEISSYFGRQIIMVTHQHDLAAIADRAFQVEIIGDSSKVTELTLHTERAEQ